MSGNGNQQISRPTSGSNSHSRQASASNEVPPWVTALVSTIEAKITGLDSRTETLYADLQVQRQELSSRTDTLLSELKASYDNQQTIAQATQQAANQAQAALRAVQEVGKNQTRLKQQTTDEFRDVISASSPYDTVPEILTPDDEVTVKKEADTPGSEALSEALSKLLGKEDLRNSYRRRLPDPPLFSGVRREFPAWCLQITAKITVDMANDPASTKFWYIHSRLEGNAITQVTPWVTWRLQSGDTITIEDIKELNKQLDHAYGNPHAKEQAMTALQSMEQGKKPFVQYIGLFERRMIEAGGHTWEDTLKKSMLLRSLNLELRKAIVAVTLPDEYQQFVSLLYHVSHGLDALKTSNSYESNYKPGGRSDPVKINSLGDSSPKGRKRAKWLPQKTVDYRRENGLCLRCASPTHLARACNLAPAVRPKDGPTNLGAVDTSSQSDEDDDSGKE